MTDYVYDDAFNGNVLVDGKSNCVKRTFLQKLGTNNFFCILLKIECISCIQLSRNTDGEI